jgi:hypothetical protein
VTRPAPARPGAVARIDFARRYPRRGARERSTNGRSDLSARVLRAAAAALLLPLALTGETAAQQTESATNCARCHADREFLAGRGASPAAADSLFVPDSLVHDSRHATLSCASCHEGYGAAYPHQPATRTVTCGSCHQPADAAWRASVHATNAAGAGDAPTCVRCHGAHRVLGTEDRASPTHPLNEAELCGSCHDDARIIEAYFGDPADSVARTAVARFHETVHGLAVADGGLVVTATCSDCHRPHRVQPSDSAASAVSRDSVAFTCGACHVGVLEDYRTSAHGLAHARGDTSQAGEPAPVCIDCHSAHEIVAPDATWRAAVVEECGACHESLYETYLDTYHGKVTRLGSTLAAKCSDCHTPHANLPADDPASSVHATNLVATCSKCHEGVTARFTQYLPHAEHTDRENHPQLYWPWLFMTSLLFGTFGFFYLHTGLWLVRGLVDVARGRGRARPHRHVRQADGAAAAAPRGPGADATTEPPHVRADADPAHDATASAADDAGRTDGETGDGPGARPGPADSTGAEDRS